jgi:hypothetical protein
VKTGTSNNTEPGRGFDTAASRPRAERARARLDTPYVVVPIASKHRIRPDPLRGSSTRPSSVMNMSTLGRQRSLSGTRRVALVAGDGLLDLGDAALIAVLVPKPVPGRRR